MYLSPIIVEAGDRCDWTARVATKGRHAIKHDHAALFPHSHAARGRQSPDRWRAENSPGIFEFTTLPSAEIYDPRTGTFHRDGQNDYSPMGPHGPLLPNGKS